MFWYQRKHQVAWISILILELIFCLETCGHNHQLKTLEGQSLEVASLIDVKGKNQNIEHGQEQEKEEKQEDMLAMVASLKGSYGDTSSMRQDEEELENSTAEKLLKCDWYVKLDQLNRYRLDWTVDYAGNEIIFALNINHSSSKFQQGSDIFALGFSENGELPSSDFCIIWYDLSHKLHLQDAQTDSKNRLQLIDSAQSQCKLLRFPPSSSLPRQTRRSKSRRLSSKWESNNEERYEQQQQQADSDEDPTIEKVAAQSIEIYFKRPLDVCNPVNNLTNYYRIDNGTTHLVWFTIKGPLLSIDGLNLTELTSSNVGSTSKVDNSSSNIAADGEFHSKAPFEFGMKRVQLIATKANEVKSAATMSLDIRMEQFEIPAQETTYWCKLFKLPHKFESRKYHLTKYEAVIERGNEHIVHHMELFNCANLDKDQEQGLHDLYNGLGWSGNCGDSNRPRATKPCRRVILAWAMGAQPLVYPEQVGQSIGGYGYSPYVVLEVHYNNVESRAGLLDNSGLRFHYTSKLRPFDAGVLEVGLEYTDKNSIPPNLVAPIAGHCVSECTRVSMASSSSLSTGNSLFSLHHKRDNKHHRGREEEEEEENEGSIDLDETKVTKADGLEDGIYIFAGQMHTHLTGVASWTEIVREGKLLGELQRDNHYSPHFQEIRLLPKPVHVAPGDALIHYCLYDTRRRVNITLGGFGTSDEMCVTYLHYYPKIDLEVCKSSVDTGALEQYFAYLAKEENQNTSEKLIESSSAYHSQEEKVAKSVSENYRSIRWTRKRSKELLQFYANAPLSVQCNRSNGDRWPGYWNGIAPTRLWSKSKATETEEPFVESHLPTRDELISYRGRHYGDRHAQCEAQ